MRAHARGGKLPGAMLPSGLHLATTEAEKEAVYRFRYDAYFGGETRLDWAAGLRERSGQT